MGKKHLYILCSVLVVIGVAVTAYRMFVLDFPALPEQTSEIWRIETKIEFDASGKQVKLDLQTPQNFGPYVVVSQNYVAPGYGTGSVSDKINRTTTFSRASVEGRQTIYAGAIIHRVRSRGAIVEDESPTQQRSRYTGSEASASQALVLRLSEQSADAETFTRLLVAELSNPPAGREAAALLGANRTSRNVMRTAARVLADANIPARPVHGIALEPDRRNAQLTHWVEFWEDGKWYPLDPATGAAKLPARTMPLWRGDTPMFRLTGGVNASSHISIRRVYAFTLRTALDRAQSAKNRLVEFSLFGLPLQTQEVYRLLLVVPIGILFLVVLRNVVGIKTFGTFMPVLIALAFRETQLLGGVIMFSVVVAIGLLVRFYLEQLKLLLVPRLACVVMVVIIIMTILSIVAHKLGFDRGLSVALFPIVILAMTIERMTVVWDERGPKEAMQQGFGSLAVAILCYLVMNIPFVQHFLFVFPESLLIVLAGCLLLGRYSGYRLVELPRFRVLAGGR
ncbi:MAG: UUP1 family membrane protein [Alphaproteobacteria bacterium]